MKDVLLEKNSELTEEEKKLFKYFGEGAKIRPPFRILNPHRISIGDFVSIREDAYIHAYQDLTSLHKYIKPEYQDDFKLDQYRYDSEIIIERESQIGRNLFISSTKSVTIGSNVTISERVFIGDNNHSFSHPYVPIMQQPNKIGASVYIGEGSWVGAGSSITAGSKLGRNSVVATLTVVKGKFPDHGVIGTEPGKLLFIKDHDGK